MSTTIDETIQRQADEAAAKAMGQRTCIDGSDPDGVYPVPSGWAEDEDYRLAPDLERTARLLVGACPELAHLNGAELRFLWARKGSRQNGKDILGKAQKPGGLLAWFTDADFIVVLSAEHLAKRRATRWQVEGVLFHELSHCSVDDETGKPAIVGHDFTGFRAEVERYGAYLDDLVEAADSFAQLTLGLGR